MRKVRLRKLNNQGSTFVLAIIVITLVTMLAVAILAASAHNIAMKNVDRNSKANFYTAETVVDEVSAGVGIDGMNLLGSAYEEVITNLIADSAYGYEYIIDNDEANKKFKVIFIESMLNKISDNLIKFEYGKESVNVTKSVDGVAIDKVKKYLNDYIVGYSSGMAGVTNVGSVEAYKEQTEYNGKMYSYIIIIRDVVIKYKEEKGGETYFSNVTTDIEIRFPNMTIDFTATSRLDDFTKYVFIADDDIGIEGETVNSSACMYAGYRVNINATDSYSAKLCMEKNGVENINLVCGGNTDDGVTGTIALTGGLINTKAYFDAIGTNIWCTNIKTSTNQVNGADGSKGAEITIKDGCSTFVKDDLTVEGQDSTVSLGGEYYGYSSDGATYIHANSSAIIVNGKRASMTIATNKLLLGGHSYVELGDTDYYMLGESLSFRGDQEIYLVPTDYLGIGYELPVPNPMAATTWENLCNAAGADSNIKICDLTKGDSKKDNDFFALTKGYVNETTPYIKKEVGDLVYLYLNFNTADAVTAKKNAAKYVYDVANGAKGVPNYLKTLLEQYTTNLFEGNVVKIEDGAKDSIYTQGSLLTTSDGSQAGNGYNVMDTDKWTAAYPPGMTGYANDEFTLTSLDLEKRYTILTHILADIPWTDNNNKKYIVNDIENALVNTRDYYVGDELSSPTIFDLIIDTDLIKDSDPEEIYNKTNQNIKYGDNDYIKVIRKGNYTIDSNTVKGGIVVATGDVHVNGDFDGMIIAGGSIIVDDVIDADGVVTLTNNAEVVKTLIQQEYEFIDGTKETIPFREYFKAFKYTAINDDITEPVEVEKVNYKDIIKINNWRKYEDNKEDSTTS